MGCGVSRIDANGMVVPARLWPIFLQRQEEFPAHKPNSPINKDYTPIKKEPLLHDMDDDNNTSNHYHHSSNASKSIPVEPKGKEAKKPKGEAPNKESSVAISKEHMKHQVVKEESSRGNGKNSPKETTKAKEDTKIEEDAFTDTDYEDMDEDYDERMICHVDDDAFPGSPSFRVFFKDNGKDYHNDIGKNDAYKVPSDDDTMSPKESFVKTNVKRGRKKRSFKLPKGLNVKLCCTPPSHSSHDHHAHLLPARKTTA